MPAPVEFHTQRLLLRPFCAGDVEDALAYRNDTEFARFLSHIPQPFTLQDAQAFVRQNMAESQDSSVTFAIVLGGKVIGTVNLELDVESGSAMLGYAIGRAWWGQGIATEAAQAAMKWGVQAYNLKRIWASTDIRNLKSQRVLEKLGMMRETIINAHHVGRNGERIDEVVYGLDMPC